MATSGNRTSLPAHLRALEALQCPGNPDNSSTSQALQTVIDLTLSSPAYGRDERDALPSYSHFTTHTISSLTHENNQLTPTGQTSLHLRLDDESIDPFASFPSSVHSDPLPTLYTPTDTYTLTPL